MSNSNLSVQLYTVRELLTEDTVGTLRRIAEIGFTQVEPFGLLDFADGMRQGLAETGNTPYATEFTCWTSLSDLDRKRFYVRDYRALNYVGFDLAAVAAGKRPASLPLTHFTAGGADGSAQLLGKAG